MKTICADIKVELDTERSAVMVGYVSENPNLLIHPSFNDSGWTITHKPTGRGIFSGIESSELAGKLAGALSGLPIAWEEVRTLKLQMLREKLSSELVNWFLLWRAK